MPIKFDYWFSKGNAKLGPHILSWSTFCGPEDERRTVVVEGHKLTVGGTCGGFCGGCRARCYAYKAERQYSDVRVYRAKNTYGTLNDMETVFGFLGAQLSRKKKPWVIRINQSGELTGIKEFRWWLDLARAFPQHTLYVYTKAYRYVTRELLKLGDKVPSNFHTLFSVWGNKGVKAYEKLKHVKNVKAFVYVSETVPAVLKPETWCPAYGKDGKMNHNQPCERCKKCFSDGAKVIACRDH